MAERDEQARRDERTGTRGGAAANASGTEREATDIEREGMDLLGRSSVRDDAIAGVSDASVRADQSIEADAGNSGGTDDATR